MKDKTKKILAGMGVGLTLAGGGLVMTGCTETPVTDAQVDKVFTALDNANKFMEDTKDLLDKQNAELANLKDIISQESQEQLINNVLSKYKYAVTKLRINKDNFWDNLKVTAQMLDSHEEDVLKEELSLFKLNSGVNVLCYKCDDRVYSYADSTQEAKYEENEGHITSISSFEYYASMHLNGTIGSLDDYIIAENVVDCSIADNGNYLMTLAFKNLYNMDSILDVEISANGNLIGIDFYMMEASVVPGSNGQNNTNYHIINMKATYEYGVLTESEVQANIDEWNESQK